MSCNSHTVNLHPRQGTAIVTALTSDQIWIASDSKQTTINGDVTVCKILSNKNMNVVVVGTAIWEDESGHIYFDANRLIQATLDKNKSFEQSCKELDEIIKQKLTEHNRFAIANKSHALFEKPKYLLELSMTAFVNNVPNLKVFTYYLTGTISNWTIESKMKKSDSPIVGGVLSLTQGHNQAMIEFLNKNQNYFKNNLTKEGLIKLINIAVTNNPKTVGLPIVVKVLTHKENKWLTAHDKCL